MSTIEIVCAWKDAQYREALSAGEQKSLPEHPAGSIEMRDEDLSQIEGGVTSILTSLSGPVLCDFSNLFGPSLCFCN
ncbi:MAG TPA: mersacidin/lichenicidin family type 2 lantibiotic [Ktedonosporobacter sp.]|nr:mersacidin/lichenicidin family type 2 lantibiotic [Ktedonosporobacter sp.]